MTPVGGPSRIRVLPAEVIGRIAAGEVIERPASVVKELIENSLDAGSTTITVEVKDGGLGAITVIDNGEGMAREDALLAFERHATSKLRSDADLDTVSTLGFRGEALPSIAAVSKVTLSTTMGGEQAGTSLSLVGGRVTAVKDAVGVPGTRIEVAELFFNTPARKKFLKSTATEFSHISQVVQHASLAWPQVHFRLLHNGHEALNYPAVSRHRDRVFQIYRGAFLSRTLEVHAEQRELGSLSGYIINPLHARASRAPQDLFVNRRPIRNPTVLHALSDSYSAFLAKGTHPVFVLFFDVDSRRVDVNVHPTKREVRFADAELVHRIVRSAVRDTLMTSVKQDPAVLSISNPGTVSSSEKGSSVVQSTLAGEARRESPMRRVGTAVSRPDVPDQRAMWAAEALSLYEKAQGTVIPLGQVFRTFLVAQVDEELHVVDQHTAHERVLFERLQRQWRERALVSQPLLLPQAIDVAFPQAELIRKYAGELEQLGLVVEPFGATSFIIRSVPAILTAANPEALLQDVVSDLEQWNSTSSLEERLNPIMASLACHGAVRAGRAMALPEIKTIIETWIQEGQIMTCPHGRRVAFRLSADELARMFNRA